MAIDTKSLTQIISEFRKLQTKDSITPESLGYILQRIADLLATAGTSETQQILGNWYNSLSKVDHNVVFKLQQGSADRNFVRLSNTFIDLLTGTQSTNENATIINMATTERAGVMKAQQVVDLNNARRAVADIQKLLDTIQAKLGMTDGSKGLYNAAQIQVSVENGKLRLYGAQQLITDGYVPYLFRLTRKRNPWDDKVALEAGATPKKYGDKRKGWNLFGTVYMVKIASGNILTFNAKPHHDLCTVCDTYSSAPETLVKQFNRHKDNAPCIGWGRSEVCLLDPKNAQKHRFIRLRFALGFAKKILPGRSLITTANLVSSLAEFTVIYNPSKKTWHFGK
ncbi:MAG: hypothetical protein LIP02_07310 [Bacteroidales bacterium]|nr:hypothetical protein [Bacteroidales bacterium]